MKIKHAWIGVVVLLQGCVGHDSVLFVTRSNLGVDMDTAPARTEVSIDRSEFIIAPTFEEGKTIPASASFKSKGNPFYNFAFGADHTYALGAASVMLTALYSDPDAVLVTNNSSVASGMPFGSNHLGSVVVKNTNNTDHYGFKQYQGLELDNHPTVERVDWAKFWLKDERIIIPFIAIWRLVTPTDYFPKKAVKVALPDPGLVRPVVFGTDTSLGASIKWTGTAPTAVKFGFNRKEASIAPVIVHENIEVKKARNGGSTTTNKSYTVNVPSLFASLQSNIKADNVKSGKIDWLQYFATGEPAENLVLRRGVRVAMLNDANPQAQATDEAIKKAIKEEEKKTAREAAVRASLEFTNFISELKTLDSTNATAVINYYNSIYSPKASTINEVADAIDTAKSRKKTSFLLWYDENMK